MPLWRNPCAVEKGRGGCWSTARVQPARGRPQPPTSMRRLVAAGPKQVEPAWVWPAVDCRRATRPNLAPEQALPCGESEEGLESCQFLYQPDGVLIYRDALQRALEPSFFPNRHLPGP